MSKNSKEKRFLDALEALFTGADVDGNSGYINLMRIKREYFKSTRQHLLEKIDERTQGEADFREELFDKLYTFFSRYFCESGSIYFRHLPAFSKTYEQVYESGEDVALAWKTRMLYYVKSDVLVRSMPVEIQDDALLSSCKLFFDASKIEHRRNNERREFVFEFSKIEKTARKEIVHLTVRYSQNGTKTNLERILKEVRKISENSRLTDRYLQQAIQVFKRQTEADFFIHRDARGFLREQFDLWMCQYLFREETVFEQRRLSQLQAIQYTAYDIINFIAQFEDELRRVWEKPKFVRNVNYVVTLDKIPSELLEKILRHKGAKAQVKEWQELNLVDKGFSMATLDKGQRQLEEDGNGPTNGDYRFLPLDTRHFKDMEIKILEALGNLDEVLDGELVNSENWQALNALRQRYKRKVKCIYIDPPFNLDSSDHFDYRTNYKDSCWATMLTNRLTLARDFLRNDGALLVRCDHNGNWIVRCLLDKIFGRECFQNELIVNRFKKTSNAFTNATESIFLYFNSDNSCVTPPERGRVCIYCNSPMEPSWNWAHSAGPSDRPRFFDVDGKRTPLHPPKGRHWTNTQEKIDDLTKQGRMRINHSYSYKDCNGKTINYVPEKLQSENIVVDNNWTDMPGYAFGVYAHGFPTENSEELVQRIIESASDEESIVLDFFSGSGTSQAVAQKLNRKWIGVEMGEHFDTVVLPRMKKVLFGRKFGISEKVAYKGGGVFKYYSMEQYEDTLSVSAYSGGRQLDLDSTKSPFEQYVFFGDEKLTHTVTALKNKKLKINLKELYPDIDIAESISNIIGKPIQHRTADEVTFTDGSTEKINPKTMTEEEKLHFVGIIKPYLWWGEDESV